MNIMYALIINIIIIYIFVNKKESNALQLRPPPMRITGFQRNALGKTAAYSLKPQFMSTDEGNSKGYKIVTLQIPLGKGFQDLEAQFRPLFASSEFIVVSYKVPFGLNIERPPKNFPCPTVTKDGPDGEKVGDVLRATTCFSQGFQAAGLTSDIAQFAGNIKWRRGIFDTTGAQWDNTVAALLSNTAERTDIVTLVFERDTGED